MKNAVINSPKKTLLGHEYYAPHRRVFLIEDTDELTGRPLKAYAIETRSGSWLFVKTARIFPIHNTTLSSGDGSEDSL